jgi:two-component system cell cycle response regulator
MGHEDTTIIRQLAAPTRCNVLVVDDDELVRTQLASLLRLAGYQVQCAESGAQALSILELGPCEIVLTDWEMPDMDGPSLCKALRLRDNERYTYVIMLSIRNAAADILCGLHAGVDDYVVKGAPAEELLARVEVGRRITHLEHALRISSEENRRLSVTDALTGAHNRRYLMKYLPRELARARRYGHPVAYELRHRRFQRSERPLRSRGRGRGAAGLRCPRALLYSRTIDWIARAGGEEFVVVLPETALLWRDHGGGEGSARAGGSRHSHQLGPHYREGEHRRHGARDSRGVGRRTHGGVAAGGGPLPIRKQIPAAEIVPPASRWPRPLDLPGPALPEEKLSSTDHEWRYRDS